MINCLDVIRIADRAYLYDNSIENSAARLLFRTVDGVVHKTYGDMNPWAHEILKKISSTD